MRNMRDKTYDNALKSRWYCKNASWCSCYFSCAVFGKMGLGKAKESRREVGEPPHPRLPRRTKPDHALMPRKPVLTLCCPHTKGRFMENRETNARRGAMPPGKESKFISEENPSPWTYNPIQEENARHGRGRDYRS